MNMDNFFTKEQSSRMGKMLLVLVFFIAIYFAMKFVNQVKTFSTIGMNPKDATTIDVSGDGEAYAIPDVATITFNVSGKGPTIAVAQTTVDQRVNQAMDYIAKQNVAKADIQTTDYSANPEYSTPCNGYGVPCPATDVAKILDYEVSETVTVKVRDTSAAGTIVDGIGAIGVSGLTGPSFTVDNPDAVQASAKQKAIDDAQAKAQVLAKQLGLHLGKIVRFTDGGTSTPMPMMYAAKTMDAMGAVAPSANLAAGQNKYDSNVTITYDVY